MKIKRFCRKTFYHWDDWVKSCIELTEKNYENKTHNLNLSKSGFIKSEVYRADECVYLENENQMVGFVFLLTKKRPSSLYISLMVSLQRGTGTTLLNFLENSLIYSHKYIVLRATLSSVGFYIKNGFNVFDFISLCGHGYVNGSIYKDLSTNIKENIENKEHLKIIQHKIIEQNLMPKDCDDFPLLKTRNIPESVPKIRVLRLRCR